MGKAPQKSLLVGLDGQEITPAGSGEARRDTEHQKVYVIFAVEMPPQAINAHPHLIERTLFAPMNAYRILKGIAVQAARQLGRHPVDQRLVREVVRATSPAPAGRPS